MTEQPDQQQDVNRIKVGEARILRFWQDIGKSYDQSRETLTNLKNQGIFVYNLNIKWPRPANPDFLLICKAVTEDDGSVIAFHNSSQWGTLIPGFASRLMAGAIEWRPDEYPPDNWQELIAFHHERSTYIE